MSARVSLLSVTLLALPASACSSRSQVEHRSAVERGRELFRDGSAAVYGRSCASCHPSPETARTGQIFPGSALGGVTRRRSFWGGQENDLLRSVNHCRLLFQGARSELEASSDEAADLYAYLDSLEGDGEAVPFTLRRTVADLEPGDAATGAAVFAQACASCHGALHTGQDGVRGLPVLPEDSLREHREFSRQDQRLIFMEKVRHGGFFGYGGHMPPFSLEVLPDPELADALSALGLDP